MKVSRTVVFRYFTVDSIILCAATCFAAICTQKASDKVRKAVMLFRYAGTSAVMVTMMTVLLFLSHIYGYPAMFAGWNLWLHLLGPLLAVLSFAWLERDGSAPEKKHVFLSVLPVIVYGAVYMIMVVLKGEKNGGWPDFYGFNMNGRWYLSALVMIAGTLLTGIILRKMRMIRSKADQN